MFSLKILISYGLKKAMNISDEKGASKSLEKKFKFWM